MDLLRKLFGGSQEQGPAEPRSETNPTLRRIAAAIEALEPKQAQFVAAFFGHAEYITARAAYSDKRAVLKGLPEA